MDELKKKLIAKSALPEGWGRTVVGGREIITKPSGPARSAPMQREYSVEMESVGDDNKYEGMDLNAPLSSFENNPVKSDSDWLEENMINQENGIKMVDYGGKMKKFVRDPMDLSSIYTSEDGITLFDTTEDQDAAEQELIKIYDQRKR